MMRHIIADGLIFGMAAAFLWHFSNMWLLGPIPVFEANILVRSIETTGLFGIALFGIDKFISDVGG